MSLYSLIKHEIFMKLHRVHIANSIGVGNRIDVMVKIDAFIIITIIIIIIHV